MYDGDFLARLEGGLRAALPRWGLPLDTGLSLLTISENATFKATGTGQGDLVFRVHRPGYHTRAEIASELAWLTALRDEEVVATPRPVPLAGGGLIADIDDAGTQRQVVAFDFVPGAEPAADAGLVGWFRELGGIHAGLHAHSRRWRRPEGFVRKRWNFASTLGAAPLWGDWRAGLGLDDAGRALLQRTVDVLERHCVAFGESEGNFGLIHADLRLANLLVDGDRLSLIDFDDCGFSWYLYDFAAAISFIEHEPYIPELEAAWIEGYRSHAQLSTEEAQRLPVFVMLRRILLTAWIASHSETPTAREMGLPYTEGTLALAENFLTRFG
ncbi:phosphotransferase enzyme family protein [Azorhizobium doebereinerae]|uniref:phosphotransferase enzyme family protein n=1 Tax=Azorhizobium doebereinerae TaxID=281091 RepID=UPI0004104231|nr:phosphotransferase [Azorhizobium doebereinerae]